MSAVTAECSSRRDDPKIAQPFKVGYGRTNDQSPGGTAENIGRGISRPFGTRFPSTSPNAEALGYCRISLREKTWGNNWIPRAWLWLVFLLAVVSAQAAPPRVFLLDPAFIESTRQKIRAGDQSFAPALQQLKEDAADSLKTEDVSVVSKTNLPPSGDKHDFMSEAPYYWPNPDTTNGLPYIRRDGERNPGTRSISDRRNLGHMVGTVETLSLAYYFTTNEPYAAKAAELLRAWFLNPATRMNPNFEYAQAVRGQNTGRGTGLIEAVGFTVVVDSVGMLAGSKAWTKRDQAGLEDWFSHFLKWMQESPNGRAEAAAKNNHGSFYDLQVACYSLFLDKTNEARAIVEEVKRKRIAKQIETDGRQPLELERTKGWGYSVFNLRALFSLATVGERVEVDLWHFETSDGRSIRKALDFLLPFALKQKKWPYRQIGQFPAQELYSPLRQAAVKYPQAEYQKFASQLPSLSATSRARLLYPPYSNRMAASNLR
jgi:hypothetical protein